MADQVANIQERRLGGSMRLGAYACRLKKGTIAGGAYSVSTVRERHRHRYEVSNTYIGKLEKNGLVVSGINPERNLVEIIELKNHPFFLGTQFHPELKSRPLRPHPLFVAFIKAASKIAAARPSLLAELPQPSLGALRRQSAASVSPKK